MLNRFLELIRLILQQHNIQLEVFDHDAIEFGEIIGKGGEGVVQKCTVQYNDLPVSAAVKTIVNNSDDALNITLYEIELLWLEAQSMLIPPFPTVAGTSFRFFPGGQHFDRLPRGGKKYKRNCVQKTQNHYFSKSRGANAPPCPL